MWLFNQNSWFSCTNNGNLITLSYYILHFNLQLQVKYSKQASTIINHCTTWYVTRVKCASNNYFWTMLNVLRNTDCCKRGITPSVIACRPHPAYQWHCWLKRCATTAKEGSQAAWLLMTAMTGKTTPRWSLSTGLGLCSCNL